MIVTERKPSAAESSWLDLLRWSSSLLVAAHHIRTGLFVDSSDLLHRNILIDGFYFLTLFGRAPVVIFFVLSGYLVGGAALRMCCSTKQLCDYAFDRLTRLYIVIVPGFLVIYLLVRLLGLGGASPVGAASISMITFGGNLLFLQKISVGCFAGDFPLWSLANEFWYYLMFPLVLMALLPHSSTLKRSTGLLGVIALCLFLPKNILLYFLHWLVGMSVNLIRKPIRINFPLSVIFLAATMLISRLFFAGGNFFFDLLLACATALTILTSRNPSVLTIFLERSVNISRFLAGFSFSLYILHVPFLYSIKLGGFHLHQRIQPSVHGMCIYFLIFSCAITGSLLFALLTEFRTRRIRGFIRGIIHSLGLFA